MELQALIAVLAALSGIVLGWAGRTREVKNQVKHDAQEQTQTAVSLQADVDYIKRGIDDIRADLHAQGQRVDGLAERVTRVEESAKQAHRRIDRIEKEE